MIHHLIMTSVTSLETTRVLQFISRYRCYDEIMTHPYVCYNLRKQYK